MGPFGSTVASTFLWFSVCIPFIFGKVVNDYNFQSFMTLVITPVLVSVYLTNEYVTPYFVIPWEVILPLFVIMYGILMLLSLISNRFKNAVSGRKDWAGVGYVTLTVFLIIMFGMLAYYYTPLYSFSPLSQNGNGGGSM